MITRFWNTAPKTVPLLIPQAVVGSASIAMICTSTGVCIGQLIKKRKRFHASTDKLWVLSGLFLLSIIISLCIYFFFDNNPNKVTYILLMNLVLALGSILYIYITREKT